jgi:hypothetical protein
MGVARRFSFGGDGLRRLLGATYRFCNRQVAFAQEV